MRTGSTIADPPVPVTLREQEMLRRGKRLAEQIEVRTGLVDAKKAANKKAQDEIDELDEEIAAAARVIIDGFENRGQGDLFVDQTLPKDEAAQRIAEIAARALKHPFVASESAIDTCSREGCGAQAGADVHIAPLPSEAHTFVPDGKGEGKCWACESDKDDPVHAEPAAAAAPADPNAPHAAVLGDQPEGEPKACVFCTRAVDDPIHAEIPVATDGQEQAAAAAVDELATFVCADCEASGASLEASTHPKADGVWLDRDANTICPNCRQVAIENGAWPHVFEAGKGRKGKNKCLHCELAEDERVHVALEDAPSAVPAGDVVVHKTPGVLAAEARAAEIAGSAEDEPVDGPVGGEA